MTTFWNKKWGKESLCGITHSRLRPGGYSDGTPRCIFLECSHGFYIKPLFEWIREKGRENAKCPLCRLPINTLYLYTSIQQRKSYLKRKNYKIDL
jgi:hypothetical protein